LPPMAKTLLFPIETNKHTRANISDCGTKRHDDSRGARRSSSFCKAGLWPRRALQSHG
jgi:hypothetical protein